jgi:replicative DNA helicase
VQVAAVNIDQTRNTFTLFPGMVSDRLKNESGMDIGKTIIYARQGRARLEAVTSSPRALEGGRGTFVIMNEALALDTPIPGPSGWTTMGALTVGDVIYGADGAPARVTEAFPVQEGRRCFEVTFSDGTSFVASDGHLWQTKVAASAAKSRIRTTLEMFEDGRTFRVPAAGARQAEPVELPVDPYLLGLWLGDGSTGQSNISVGELDLHDTQAELLRRGTATKVLAAKSMCPRITFSNRKGFGANMGTDIARAFRSLSCYRSKHVPELYFTGSIDQRTELVRGMMDSDGCCSKSGTCIFVGNDQLSSDLLKLLRSLGQLAARTFAPDPRSRVGGAYRVTFTPRGGFVPFAQPRKVARIQPTRRDGWVSIKDIVEVASVPVRCISVAAEDRLFQAGEAGHVTHNTHHWLVGNEGIQMAKVIKRNAGKSRDASSRALAITNAHLPGEGSVGEKDWEAFEKERDGEIPAMGVLYDSIEAPDGLDPKNRDDVAAGILAARGDSHWASVERTVQEFMDPGISDAEAQRFYWNKICGSDSAWIDLETWKSRRLEEPIELGDRVCLGFDGSLRDDSTALIACRLVDGHTVPLAIWEKPEGPAGNGWQVPRLEVDGLVDKAFRDYDVVRMYCDPPHWQDYVDRWAATYGDKVVLEFWTNSGIRMAKALERLHTAVMAGELTHNGDPILSRHVGNAVGVHRAGGVQINKRKKSDKIDSVVASTLAYEARNDAIADGALVNPLAAYIPWGDL